MAGGKRSSLQGIRGVAIIFVLIFHFFPTVLPKEWIGVDMLTEDELVEIDDSRPITEDKEFRGMLKTSNYIEQFAKKESFVEHNEKYGRKRIEELRKRCKKCEIFDYLPFFTDKDGKFAPYDVKKDEILVDDEIHLTQFGKEWVRSLYKTLASRLNSSGILNSTHHTMMNL